MKICVYAIAKNEENFVDRWVRSMSEADEIYVLDTGSSDQTVKKLREAKVNVVIKPVVPFRFDVARNESLRLVPIDTDICVCTDLDEVFLPGWRSELEKAWSCDVTRARYNYNWKLDCNDKPIVNFYIDKIHERKNYTWKHPVHEVLVSNNKENFITLDNITLNHYPDSNKSRASYLPLLELSVREDPEDDRNMHYLGREYMYYGEWEKCIDTLKKHLNLRGATWKDERCASMRFIARSYINLGDYSSAIKWLDKAIKEAPYLRDAYVEKALFSYKLGNFLEVERDCLLALNIKENRKSYINESFSWDGTVYDLLAISNYYQRRYEYANYFNDLALEMDPNNERLKNNKLVYEQKIGDNNIS